LNGQSHEGPEGWRDRSPFPLPGRPGLAQPP
jgi:hypothetical protein